MSDLTLLALLVWCVLLMTNKRKQAKANPSESNRTLTRGERMQVWIICVLQPLWAGFIFYYGWRRPLPVMAKQANRISWIAFGIELGVFILGLVLYLTLGKGA
ncbi:hypothetical protein BH11PAT2_BH11PAT2_06050 [soil metagenome]